MWYDTPVTRRLGIAVPIIQAPMAGGATTPELVAAVSKAGGLGSLGAGYMSAEAIRSAVARIRALTDKPFAINLFVPEREGAELGASVQEASADLAPVREELGLDPEPALPNRFGEVFAEQVEAVLEARPALFSFTFGCLEAALLERFRAVGTLTAGTATTVDEARLLADAGCDFIVAQGAEAGGHRGSFAIPFEQAMIGTVALVPQIADAVEVPVIASGGLMDGRGIAAALTLGAAAAQLGTAYLRCDESGISAPYAKALASGRADGTEVTRAFSGKPARGLRNRFMVEMQARGARLAPYPVQNALTRDIRTAAAKADRPEFLSLWAGQGIGLSRHLPAAALTQALIEETERALTLTR